MNKVNTGPIFPDRYYHIFNRGINEESIFKNENNYFYFLNKLNQYVNPIGTIHAYCLLSNHFHFLLKTKTELEIRNNFNKEKYLNKQIEFIISKQFSNFFNGYSQAINKMFERTGGLFETPFRRKEITSNEYLTQTILYIHLNPIKHQLNIDYKNYLFSSYKSIINSSTIDNNKVIEWFGNKNDFIQNHELFSERYKLK
jgi:REP element-mobilizing transposase RayT